MILVVDNYDSFVHNLARYVREAGVDTQTIRNDALAVDEVRQLRPKGIILSPGPGRPDSAGICLELVAAFPETPILGVCLGHQCVAEAYGGRTISSRHPMHGRQSRVVHDGSGVFVNLVSPLLAGRYHSLSVEIAPGGPLVVQARADDGEIMAVRHLHYPHHGVQFHPESLLTPLGKEIIRNFLDNAGAHLQ